MNHRVQFDFEIAFTNGGGIQGHDFRLDIAGDDISDRELADYLVADMRLLMVGAVRIFNKKIIAEPHKRARKRDVDRSEPHDRRWLGHLPRAARADHLRLPEP